MAPFSQFYGGCDFTYYNLPDPATHIRLLNITSAHESIPVECFLSEWNIESAPSYNAISYTWGNPISNTTIVINNQCVAARANCEYALRQAYRCDNRPPTWINALCVNQKNIPEKECTSCNDGTNIQLAQRVLACVGHHSDDSEYMWRVLWEHRYFYKIIHKTINKSDRYWNDRTRNQVRRNTGHDYSIC